MTSISLDFIWPDPPAFYFFNFFPLPFLWPTDFFPNSSWNWYLHVDIIMITNPPTTLWRHFLSISFDLTHFFQLLSALRNIDIFMEGIIMITNPIFIWNIKSSYDAMMLSNPAHQLLSPVPLSFFHVMTLRHYQSHASTVVTVMFLFQYQQHLTPNK